MCRIAIIREEIMGALLVLALVVLASCSSKPPDIRSYEKANPYPGRETYFEKSKGSLYTGGYWADIYGENRATKPGDLIFIRVEESLNAVERISNQMQRVSNFSNTILSFFGLPQNTLQNLYSQVEGNYGAQSQGRVQQQATLVTRLAGRVIKVYPNGTMLIEAKKYIAVNGFQREFVLRGVIRPEDIDSSNTVSSDKIANMEVFLDGKGYVAEGGKPGWLARIFAHLFPF